MIEDRIEKYLNESSNMKDDLIRFMKGTYSVGKIMSDDEMKKSMMKLAKKFNELCKKYNVDVKSTAREFEPVIREYFSDKPAKYFMSLYGL